MSIKTFTELQDAAAYAPPGTTIDLQGRWIELPAFINGDHGGERRFWIHAFALHIVNGTLFQPREHSGMASIILNAPGITLEGLHIIGPDRHGDAWDMTPEARAKLPAPYAVHVLQPNCKVLGCDIRCWTHGVAVGKGGVAEVANCRFASMYRAGLGYCAVVEGGWLWFHHNMANEYRHLVDTANDIYSIGYLATDNIAHGPVARGAEKSSHAFGAHNRGDGFGAEYIGIMGNKIHVPKERLFYGHPPFESGVIRDNTSADIDDPIHIEGKANRVFIQDNKGE